MGGGMRGGDKSRLWGGIWGLTYVGVVQDLHYSHLPK